MGYRSSIYIKIKKEDEDEFWDIITKHDLNKDFKKNIENGEYVGFEGHDLKWYDGYSDVKAINNFINDENHEETRGLVAIGEDNAIWEEGNPYYIGMCVNTTIDMEY